MELDIVFNIDYASEEGVNPFYQDVPKYINLVELKTVEQLVHLVDCLKEDVKCYLWVHSSLLAKIKQSGYDSDIERHVVPELLRLKIDYTKVTRSTGKVDNKDYFASERMLEIKPTKRFYYPSELKALLLPQDDQPRENNSLRRRIVDGIHKQQADFNSSFRIFKTYLTSVYSTNTLWYEGIFGTACPDVALIFKSSYWSFKSDVYHTYFNLASPEADVVNSTIENVDGIIRFDISQKIWEIDISFFDYVSLRFEERTSNYEANLEIATRLYLIHEAIHKKHNLDSNSVKGIGNFPRIIEEADYQADTVAILTDFAYQLQVGTAIDSLTSAKIIDSICAVIKIAVETTFSFNPIDKSKNRIQIRTMNRYLIWFYHYYKIESYRLQEYDGKTLLSYILKQFSQKPLIEITGPAIKSNKESNRTFYELSESMLIHDKELCILKMENEIIRVQPNSNLDFCLLFDGISESNFGKIGKFFEILFSVNKHLL